MSSCTSIALEKELYWQTDLRQWVTFTPPELPVRPHLATLLDDFRRFGREKAIVRHIGIRRKVTSYEEIARLAGRFAALLGKRGIGPGDRVVIWG